MTTDQAPAGQAIEDRGREAFVRLVEGVAINTMHAVSLQTKYLLGQTADNDAERAEAEFTRYFEMRNEQMRQLHRWFDEHVRSDQAAEREAYRTQLLTKWDALTRALGPVMKPDVYEAWGELTKLLAAHPAPPASGETG